MDKVSDVERDAGTLNATNETFWIEDDQWNLSSSVFAVSVPKNRFNEPGIVAAMQAEIDVWHKYGVYKEVKDTGQTTVTMRWIVTDKGNGRFKARLVLRGFEEGDGTAVDSPTTDKSSTKL